ncbi:MAG: phospholipase D-like domain-containing protein [Vicinamibacterales bacterium]
MARRHAGSRQPGRRPPYFLNWDEACALEPACADYARLYPTPEPMSIDTSRLEPDYPSPSDLIWGQGAEFNARLVQEIDREPARVDLVAYRLTDGSVADALIRKSRAGVPVRVIIEPEQYTSRVWPEYWLTHYYVDRLWEAGIPIRQRTHAGLTHMKVLVTSAYATNASSNIATKWAGRHRRVPSRHRVVVRGLVERSLPGRRMGLGRRPPGPGRLRWRRPRRFRRLPAVLGLVVRPTRLGLRHLRTLGVFDGSPPPGLALTRPSDPVLVVRLTV